MAKENLYWIAAGVVQVDGKDYGIDDVLPESKIDKDVLARWKKEKKVGAKIAPVSTDNGAKVKELTARIAELETELAEANGKVEKFEKEVSDLNELISEETK